MENYQIQHITEYRYTETVGFTPQLLRLFPRMDNRIRLIDYQLSLFPTGDIYWLRDTYDNAIAKYFTTEKSQQLSVTVTASIEHHQASAFDFLLDSHAIEFPFIYSESEKAVLTPFMNNLPTSPQVLHWIKSFPAVLQGNTTECLTNLSHETHRAISYQRRDTPGIQSPEETLKKQSGTCRDYALLFMAACDYLQLATRFVSGYLYADKNNEHSLGADSIHAWADVYLPGAGWRGIDPTNGVWCSHHHIPLAVSRIPADTTPIEGSYCADHVVASHLKTSLHIQKPSCQN